VTAHVPGMGNMGLVYILEDGVLVGARLLYPKDFPLVILSNFTERWPTKDGGRGKGRLVLLGDGNIGVVTEEFNPPIWCWIEREET